MRSIIGAGLIVIRISTRARECGPREQLGEQLESPDETLAGVRADLLNCRGFNELVGGLATIRTWDQRIMSPRFAGRQSAANPCGIRTNS